MIKYSAMPETESGFIVLRLEEGEFSGTEFTLGEVKFADEENEDGSINLQYDLNVINKKMNEADFDNFKTIVGDLLVDILEEQVKNNEVVYHGGVDDTKA